MKKLGGYRFPLILALIAAMCAFQACKKAPPGAIATPPSDFTRALQKLAAQSSQEGAQGCDLFAKSLAAAMQGIPSTGIAPDPVKAKAIREWVEKYPGVPPSTLQAVAKIMSEVPKDADWDLTPLTSAHTCKPNDLLNAVAALAINASHYKWDEAEKTKIREASLDAALRELRATVALNNLIAMLNLVQTLLDHKILVVSDAVFVEILRIEREATDARAETSLAWAEAFPKGIQLGKMESAQLKRFNQILRDELRRTERLRVDTVKILNRLRG